MDSIRRSNPTLLFAFCIAIALSWLGTVQAGTWKATIDSTGDFSKYKDNKRLRFFVDVIDGNGDVVQGLKSENFTLQFSDESNEDKVLDGDVEVSSFDKKDFGVAVMLVFAGHSNYFGEPGKGISPCDAQRKGLKDLVAQLGGQDKVALYYYSSTVAAKKLASFSRDFDQLKTTLNNFAKCSPITAVPGERRRIRMFKTIIQALDEFRNAEGLPKRRVLVMMSDGTDELSEKTRSVKRMMNKIESAAEENGVRIYTIGFSMEGGKYLQYLKDLAIGSKGTYRRPTKLGSVTDIFVQIGRQLKHQYIVDFKPSKFKGDNQALKFRVVVKTPKGRTLKSNVVEAADITPIPYDWLRLVIIIVSSIVGFILLIVFFRWIKNRPKKEKAVVEYEDEEEEEGWVNRPPTGPVKGKLEIVAGPLVGRIYWITEDITTIGSMEGNTIVLDDSSISKRHSGIKVEDKRYELADFGSTNGTFINSRRINKQFLRAGDKIRFGDTEMLFTLT